MKELILKNLHSVQVKRFASLAILVSLMGAVLLSGCDGQAMINFTYDATTGAGSGSVQITGAAPEDNSGGDTGDGPTTTGGSAATSQVVLFGVVVALLIGTLAVVAASSRRRRIE